MSNAPTTPPPCVRCLGCGQVANSEDREPWSTWASLPAGSDLAVRTGLVKPVPCDDCGGSGVALKLDQAPEDKPKKALVLHIEVDGFYADDLDEMAGYVTEPEPADDEARLYVVTEEWMRTEVGITLVSLPGEKCMSDDFMVKAFNGRIVGAEARDLR